jgi:hypothetical protein
MHDLLEYLKFLSFAHAVCLCAQYDFYRKHKLLCYRA